MFLQTKFAGKPDIRDANIAAFRAGYNFGETAEEFSVRYEVKPARMATGTYRNISGNLALAYGLVAGAQRAGLPLVLGAYPITPASDVLHELSKLKRFNVTTIQAEDEIAGVGAALGASFGGALGVTTSSGPGISLKSETIGLGVMLELPLVVCDIQRAGPSTGMPTKTEQADLLQVMFGRNGEAPLPVIAAQSPADCFAIAVEATRIAVTYRTPVIVLSDGYLANGSEPWQIPVIEDLPTIDPNFTTRAERDQRQGRADVPPLPARPGDPGPRLGDPRYGGSGPPHRRSGEGGQDRQHLLRPGQPRPDDPHPAGEGGRHRRPAARGRRPGRYGEGARARLGQRPTARSAPVAAGSARSAARSRRRTCGT